MVWLIVALGLALSGGGAAAIWSGLTYMPVEWGWSQLIAGATAVSGGVVTLALAALLGRLGAIHKTLRLGLIEPLEVLAPLRPSPVFTEPEAVPETVLPAAAAGSILPEPLRPGDEGTAEPDEPAAEEAAAGPEAFMPQSHTEADQAPLLEPAAPTKAERPFRPLLTGLKARFGGRRAVQDEPASRVPPEPTPNGFDEAAWALGSTSPSSPGLPFAELEEEPVLDQEAAHTTKSLVGRYDAGAASYALYSDGTIEVETETGTQRFESMDDLKHFLER